ncbi:hypothetical protein ABTN30_20120, partial [Acinetobacter baumannii]
IRFHDENRLADLGEGLFSLSIQDYQPLEVVICCQNFTEQARQIVEQLATSFAWRVPAEIVVTNFIGEEGKDHRSALANIGLATATGR